MSQLLLDVALDPSIRASGAPSDGPAETVLLTGATGFLGGYLCAELLSQTDAEIYCLVRDRSKAAGAERIRRRLSSLGVPVARFERIVAVPGDLSRPRLGLPRAIFDDLAKHIDVIYHSAASVDFLHPYRALRATNIAGTQEVLRLAAHTRSKPVHHVSTMSVLVGAFPARPQAVFESAEPPPPIGADTGYTESKWVAECILRLARIRGLPVSIYRPSILWSDSATGISNADGYLTKMIQGCVALGAAPLRDYPLEVSTVDYVARALVALSLHSSTGVYHLVDPQPMPWNAMFEYIRAAGYPIRALPYDQWFAALTAHVDGGNDNALAPLIGKLANAPDRHIPRIDCANTTAGLAGTGIAPPVIDANYFATMLQHFADLGRIPEMPARTTTYWGAK
ncbi:thioester reductase domain-containing protein [Nocardia sp. NPDC049149]|uniref:thioester reductase domain-containing protein n=1 Tax=Nocardia sp. NPDC049149 TaxID=3364315 RepID=UPI003712357E